MCVFGVCACQTHLVKHCHVYMVGGKRLPQTNVIAFAPMKRDVAFDKTNMHRAVVQNVWQTQHRMFCVCFRLVPQRSAKQLT